MIYDSTYKNKIKSVWKTIKPNVVLHIEPGEVRKISHNLLVEKTYDNRIILYEIIES